MSYFRVLSGCECNIALWNEHWYSWVSAVFLTMWCPHTALFNNIGLVLHNQTWHTRHVIVHMKLSELYSMHSTSRSCLHFFLCNPYMPLHNWQFFNLLVSCLFLSAFSRHLYTNCRYFTIHWWEIRNNDGLLRRIKHIYSSPLHPNSYSPCI